MSIETPVTQDAMVAFDAETFRLYQEQWKAEDRLASAYDTVHRAVGDERYWEGRVRRWNRSNRDAMTALRHLLEKNEYIPSASRRPSELLLETERLQGLISGLVAEIRAREAVWRAAQWTRYFPCLNVDGHIHRTLRGCPTVRFDTAMGWEASLSGLPVEDAIAKLGPRLCSTCFREAPAEHCRSLRDITRAEREVARGVRAEARFAKQLRALEEFRDHRGYAVSTVNRCKEIIRDEVELRDYYGRGRHPWHKFAVLDAARAAQVLMARELMRPGTGASAAEIAKITATAVKKNRREGARI